jgi:hypothetical protein
MKESAQALRAFQDYLAQTPPRSLERLAATYQSATEPPPPTRRIETLKDWSRTHGWQERVAAHEQQIAQEAEERARKAEVERRERFREVRLGLAAEVQAKAHRALKARADEAITPSAVVHMLQLAFQTQRLDLGEATERTALRLEDLSDEQLLRLAAAAARDAASADPG